MALEVTEAVDSEAVVEVSVEEIVVASEEEEEEEDLGEATKWEEGWPTFCLYVDAAS